MPDILPPMASIKLSIPDKVDGIIRLELSHRDNSGIGIDLVEKDGFLSSPLEYEKTGEKIVAIRYEINKNSAPHFLHLDNVAILYMNFYIEKGENYDLIFSFYDIKNKYI